MIYGATSSYFTRRGTVFSIAPPSPGSSDWQYTQLIGGAKLPDGLNAVRLSGDQKSLYVTSFDGGSSGWGILAVFELPSAGHPRGNLHIAYNFDEPIVQPNGLYVLGPRGALYGTAWSSSGGIYTLTRNATGWTEQVLATDTWSQGPLVLKHDGTIFAIDTYGGSHNSRCDTIQGCGSIFALTP